MTSDSGTHELSDGRPGYRLVRREDVAFRDPYPGRGNGVGSCRLVDGSTGSTHMALTLCLLTDGALSTHLHSYEESFYVLEGGPVLYLDERGFELKPGACGVVPVGVPHAWRGDGRALWVEMVAPRPRPDGSDTFFLGERLRPERSRSMFATRATAISSCSQRARWTSTD